MSQKSLQSKMAQALNQLYIFTDSSCQVQDLAGPRNRRARKTILRTLAGQDAISSNTGINNLRAKLIEVIDLVRVDGNERLADVCVAAQNATIAHITRNGFPFKEV